MTVVSPNSCASRAAPADKRVFHRYCPELAQGGRTPAGTPVFLQLLGGHPDYMALNAMTAEQVGAPGIDLNFGCPSKTVNRNDGGSTLLREPQRVHDIVRAVRQAVSPHLPVTAKIRLGFQDASLLQDIACGVAEAQASELCIHARTRLQGYQPPAFWEQVAPLARQLPLPLIINGEIWSPEDARRARQASGCADVMLGRGALCRPDLARAIRADQEDTTWNGPAMPWEEAHELLLSFTTRVEAQQLKFAGNRIKQWLNYLRRHYPQAEALFQQLKRLKTLEDIKHQLHTHPFAQGEALL
ncbi:MAG: tRNA-dihydrouridine synthase [Thiolinea sp.]